MALVSDTRSNPPRGRLSRPSKRLQPGQAPRSHRLRNVLVTLFAIAAVAVAAAVVLAVVALSATPTLTEDSAGLARLTLPFGSGTVEHLTVVGGREQRVIPVSMRGDTIWPTQLLAVHEQVTVEVTVKRPGWISWLNGSTQQVRLTFLTPSAHLRSQYLTVRGSQPLRVAFDQPVKVFAVGPSANLTHHVLPVAQTHIAVHQTGTAGTIYIAGAPRSWEAPRAALVSYFPAGTGAAAVASPAPGSTIGPQTPISLTFSKPVSEALGTGRPPVSPTTQGVWHQISAHTIVFRPEGYGYGLGAKVDGRPAGRCPPRRRPGRWQRPDRHMDGSGRLDVARAAIAGEARLLAAQLHGERHGGRRHGHRAGGRRDQAAQRLVQLALREYAVGAAHDVEPRRVR